MKAHRTDLVSFAFGLVFLALSVWWLLGRILGLTLPPVGWFLAGALILIGLLGLLGALRSARHVEREPADATVAAPYVEGTPTTVAPAAPEADEWTVGGVTGAPTEARTDHPVDLEPYWSPAPGTATDGGTEPTTRELPAESPAGGTSEPVTRELPAAGNGDRGSGTDGGWPAGGDEPGRREQATG